MASPVLLVMNPGNELQEVTFVTSCCVISLKVAVAVNCCGFPHPTVGLTGFTTSVVGETFLMVRTAFCVIPAIDALTTAVPGCDAFT
jgi:hypothetical protein